MVRITVRRSWSVLAMNRCSTPAPRSKPSRTTYAVIITATSQNQMKSIRRFLLGYRIRIAGIQVLSVRARAVRDLAIDEHQKQDCQHGVKAHEAEQRKQPVAGMNVFRIALAGAHESVDQPVLAIYGSGRQSMMIQRSQRDSYSFLRHSRNAAAAITAMKIVPSPAMMW